MTALAAELERLFLQQLAGWPLLARGVGGLGEARTRTVVAAGSEMLVRHIPHRAASTTAKVDAASVAARPCFLCRGNLFPEQVGLAFDPAHAIYANPFPIVERHVTVVHRDHVPQRIEGQLDAMLDLAAALPGFFVAYNGPECGASAPDHAHLQAGLAVDLPLVRECAGRAAGAFEPWGLRALLFRGASVPQVRERLSRALAVLASVTAKAPEPLCNAVAFRERRGGLAAVLFPRLKHRPAAYFSGERTVSPASIDVAGILVAPLPGDFEAITGEEVESLFGEVTLPDAAFRETVRRLGAQV